MLAVLQIVSGASVTVEKEIVGDIDKGMVILLGVEEGDEASDADILIEKIIKMRTFPDESTGKNFELGIQDIDGEFLVVSQFTLGATFKKGKRPYFIRSAPAAVAEELYKYFVQKLNSNSGLKVDTGEFGAMMEVNLTNDGPITYILNSSDYA